MRDLKNLFLKHLCEFTITQTKYKKSNNYNATVMTVPA